MRVCPCVSMYRTKMRRNTRQKESWRACAHSPVKEVRADYIDTRQTPKVPHFLWPRCQSQLEPHRTCRRMGRPSAAASRSLQKPLETFRDCALLQVLLLDSPSTTCQLFASPTASGNFRCLVAVESQKTCACYVPRLFSTPQASMHYGKSASVLDAHKLSAPGFCAAPKAGFPSCSVSIVDGKDTWPALEKYSWFGISECRKEPSSQRSRTEAAKDRASQEEAS